MQQRCHTITGRCIRWTSLAGLTGETLQGDLGKNVTADVLTIVLPSIFLKRPWFWFKIGVRNLEFNSWKMGQGLVLTWADVNSRFTPWAWDPKAQQGLIRRGKACVNDIILNSPTSAFDPQLSFLLNCFMQILPCYKLVWDWEVCLKQNKSPSTQAFRLVHCTCRHLAGCLHFSTFVGLNSF